MEKKDKTLVDNELSNDKTLIDNSSNDAKIKSKNLKASNNKSILNNDAEIDEKTGKKKIIDQKKAMLIGGGVLLSGAAYGAGKLDDDAVMIDTDNDNIADTILTDENQDGVFNIQSESEIIEEEENEEHIESKSHTFNIDTAPHTSEGTVNDNMSFAEAFAAARAELGPGGVFEWNGQLYGTFYATEVDENHNPIIDYETTENTMTSDNAIIDEEIADDNNEVVVEVEDNDNWEHEITPEVEDNDNPEHEINVDVDINTDIIGTNFVDTGNVVDDGEIGIDVPDDNLEHEINAEVDINNDIIGTNFVDTGNVVDDSEIGIDVPEDNLEHEINAEVDSINDIVGTNVVDTGMVAYDGEIAVDVPDDVIPDNNDLNDDNLLALDDNDFDDIGDWA